MMEDSDQEHYLRLLRDIADIIGNLAEEIPGEAKSELYKLCTQIESDKVLDIELKHYLLTNLTEACDRCKEFEYRYAATNINKVQQRLWSLILPPIG